MTKIKTLVSVEREHHQAGVHTLLFNLLLLLRERDCGRRSSGRVTSDFFFFFLTEVDLELAVEASNS
jgi:hypothetical protein